MNVKQPVVIDTDMAPDDWLAILFLLQHPGVDVQAITVTGAGETHCRPGVRHALDLVALAGRPEIPVACGRETPLAGNHAFPANWRERVDNLDGLSLPKNARQPPDEPAVALLARTVLGSAQKVHLITLGPLTNVAEALQAEPGLKDNLAMVAIMGGAVRVPGHVGPVLSIDNHTAEWNLYVDPKAAGIVFRSGAPITLVPLDATNDAPVTGEFYRRLQGDRKTLAAEYAYRVLTQYRDWIDAGDYYFWDPLAAAILTDERLGRFQDLRVAVVEEEGPQSGRTVESADGAGMRVTMGADRVAFETLFLDVLNRRLQ